MGYESRVFIVNRRVHDSYVFGEKLAEIELCKMGCNKDYKYFNEIFKTPIDFDLYEIEDKEEYTEEDYRVDDYGTHCKYTSINEVIKYLEGCIEEGDTYWRLKPAITTLKAWKNENTGLTVEPIVVHWGH